MKMNILSHHQPVILAQAAVDAPEFLTSGEIEAMLAPTYERFHLNQGRLEELTGVKRRGLWPKNVLPSSIAALSAQKIFDAEFCNKSDIDVLIYCAVCRDQLEPATAARLHQQLGLSAQCLVFDVTNACLGMLSGLFMATQMIETGAAKKVLLCSAENPASLLDQTISVLNSGNLSRQDIKKHMASLTLGGASVSLLIGADQNRAQAPRIKKFYWGTDSSAVELCQGSGDYFNPIMKTDAEKLLHAGIRLAKQVWGQRLISVAEELKLPDFYLTHQVGKSHHEALAQELGISKIPTYLTYAEFGNTGSAALPLSWIKACEQNKIVAGQNVVWMGIGSGLNVMMMDLVWN